MSGDAAEPNARHDDGSRRTMEPRKKALQRILSTAWLLPPPPSPQTAGSGKNRAKTIASPYRFAPPTMEELARGVAEAALAAAAKFPGSSTPPPPAAAAAAAEVATLEVHVSMVLRSSRGGHQLVTARAKIPLSSCSLAPESSAPGASTSNVDSDSGSSNSSSSSSDLGTGGGSSTRCSGRSRGRSNAVRKQRNRRHPCSRPASTVHTPSWMRHLVRSFARRWRKCRDG